MKHLLASTSLALGLSLSCVAAGTSPPPPAEPLNILLLFADDQRADTVGAWGNEHIETPNIDRLADAGFSFRRAYCMGSMHGAVCVPSRAMLHTGRSYFEIPMSMEGVPTLGELLQGQGYHTFGTGKWHNQRPSFARSFAQGEAVFFGGMCDHNQVPLVDLEQGAFVRERVGAAHSSELFADAAVRFLSEYEGEDPFFCYVAFTAPHDPRDPPPADRTPYYEDRPPLPGNFRAQHLFDNGFLYLRDEVLGAWPRTHAEVSDQLAEYYGLITHMDRQVGRILDALRESGRAERTLVVYAADHGLAVGSHGLLGKQSLYEHSMRAPLIVSGPGVPRGANDSLVYLTDLFPTLLGQAGAAVPDGVLGADVAPLWRGDAERVRETLFTSMGKTQRAVQDGRYKLLRYPRVDHLQLFDLERDPLELVNLAGDPRYAEHVERLTGELEDWQRRVGDDLPWSVPPFKPLRVDLTGRERKADRWQPQWIREKYFDR